MPVPVPDSYLRLSQFTVRMADGATIYEQGAIPDRCYVIVRGRVQFEVLDASGESQVVADAGDGDLVGHIAAFTGRPTSARARIAGDSVLIAVPFEQLTTAFRLAPELAIELLRALADPDGNSPALRRPDSPVLTSERLREHAGRMDGSGREVIRLAEACDDELFFVDTMECPVSGTVFEYLRVRTKAVRPISRDSDFYVRYRGTDPALYALLVCPGCGYTAYRDDFNDLVDDERTALRASRQERLAKLARSLCGPRSVEEGVLALDLALRCYGERRPNDRRRAVLLHRRAWAERERGNAEAELPYLAAAREAYQAAFERDSAISTESAMRAAYLIGDLWLRLGNPIEGARWLETAVREPESKGQSGLIRLARERLYDARVAHGEQRRTA